MAQAENDGRSSAASSATHRRVHADSGRFAKRLMVDKSTSSLGKAAAGAPFSDIVFAVRSLASDGHWYANIGHYAPDPNRNSYGNKGQLCTFNTITKKVTTLINDPNGAVRDPTVHYDGKKILFSYRKGGTNDYNLYEIGVDGNGLKQLTFGPYNDFEPCYLPDGGIGYLSPMPWLVGVRAGEYSGTRATDGMVGGSPNHDGFEWASQGEQNPWIKLNWPAPQAVNRMVLHDRPNPNDRAPGGVLSFSDGSRDETTPLDPYLTDQKYFESMWWKPVPDTSACQCVTPSAQHPGRSPRWASAAQRALQLRVSK